MSRGGGGPRLPRLSMSMSPPRPALAQHKCQPPPPLPHPPSHSLRQASSSRFRSPPPPPAAATPDTRRLVSVTVAVSGAQGPPADTQPAVCAAIVPRESCIAGVLYSYHVVYVGGPAIEGRRGLAAEHRPASGPFPPPAAQRDGRCLDEKAGLLKEHGGASTPCPQTTPAPGDGLGRYGPSRDSGGSAACRQGRHADPASLD